MTNPLTDSAPRSPKKLKNKSTVFLRTECRNRIASSNPATRINSLI